MQQPAAFGSKARASALLAGALLSSCQALAVGKHAHCAGLQALEAKQHKMTTPVYNAFLKVGSPHRVLE